MEVPEGAESVAKRLNQEHARMLRLRPDGSKLTWSVAAMSKFGEAGRTPKPFFITWDDPKMRPDKVYLLPANCCFTCSVVEGFLTQRMPRP